LPIPIMLMFGGAAGLLAQTVGGLEKGSWVAGSFSCMVVVVVVVG
jgi:hypothetical protein